MTPIAFFAAYLILIAILGASIFWICYRQKLFHKHMVASRKHQLRSLEAYESGDRDRAVLLLAAALEELDRAEYYS